MLFLCPVVYPQSKLLTSSIDSIYPYLIFYSKWMCPQIAFVLSHE